MNRPDLSYREFETYVLTLLEYKLKKSRKKLIKFAKEETVFQDGKRTYIEFDGIAPDGIDDLEGPTIVEFKRMFSRNSLEFLNRASNFYPKYKSLLFIVGSPLSKAEQNFFQDFASKFPKDFKINPLWCSSATSTHLI